MRNLAIALSKKYRAPPIHAFFVDKEPATNNTAIYDIKAIVQTRVTVKEPRKRREVTQCSHCLHNGHTMSH